MASGGLGLVKGMIGAWSIKVKNTVQPKPQEGIYPKYINTDINGQQFTMRKFVHLVDPRARAFGSAVEVGDRARRAIESIRTGFVRAKTTRQ
ncbi:hypothetical protein ACMD2_10328 [Ananas comosus]|uniref:Uncharacterized protein n=1 Tax=Ananas comosus TaxID=4615 RepID=A0A199UDG7_ANACO|nr:hypothetical protein ACMD2_10328 [Ananas comosus]